MKEKESDLRELTKSISRQRGPVNTRCLQTLDLVDEYLSKKCNLKVNNLKPCAENASPCPCNTGTGGGDKVDLIVLIDTSSSMNTIVSAVSDAAEEAIEKAKEMCRTDDLRVTWLGVDTVQAGTGSMPLPDTGWPAGTKFLQTHEEYLQPFYPGPFAHDQFPESNWPHEQGADAILDLSNHFDWRSGACRAIFYISDANLDALGHDTYDDIATANANAAAKNKLVSVFAHYTRDQPPETVQNYNDLCNNTGGEAIIGGAINQERYVELLADVICGACGGCKKIEIPEIKPCISISWGDSDCDCMETDDVEVLCITVCNCYTNITFNNFSIGFVYPVDDSGNLVPYLPDGTPSVEIHPIGPICFGDIGPCKDNKATCKSREIVLRTRGAVEGKYKLLIGSICFTVSHQFRRDECFGFVLCKD
jgi:hypothetical protein